MQRFKHDNQLITCQRRYQFDMERCGSWDTTVGIRQRLCGAWAQAGKSSRRIRGEPGANASAGYQLGAKLKKGTAGISGRICAVARWSAGASRSGTVDAVWGRCRFGTSLHGHAKRFGRREKKCRSA